MADIRDINKAIYAINSSAVFHIGAENSADVLDSCTIEWLEETTPISKADIQTKINELQAEYDAKEYQRQRANEYPSMADQLDDIYHNGIDGLKATIKITKDKYSKS